jgi:hypothetical protein
VSPIDAFSSVMSEYPHNIEEQLFFSSSKNHFGFVTVDELSKKLSVSIFPNDDPVLRFDINPM